MKKKKLLFLIVIITFASCKSKQKVTLPLSKTENILPILQNDSIEVFNKYEIFLREKYNYDIVLVQEDDVSVRMVTIHYADVWLDFFCGTFFHPSGSQPVVRHKISHRQQGDHHHGRTRYRQNNYHPRHLEDHAQV